jgi:hypothetical protein
MNPIACEEPVSERRRRRLAARNDEDEVIGAVNIFRHNTSKTVPGLLA